MNCPKCGNENKDDALFCSKCGLSLKITKSQESKKKSGEKIREQKEESQSDIPQILTENGIEFMLIPSGEFTMGSPENEKDRFPNEGPAHKVKIKKSFYLSKFPITQKQ
jgi:formylglycine-generating enzyme required for sulfatase activity